MGIKVSNSMIKTYLRCPQQFHYKFVERLVHRRDALPLKRGNWLHELLMVHYEGGDWEEELTRLMKPYMKLFEEEREMYGDLPSDVRRLMRGYLYQWREEDSGLTVVAAEKELEVALPHQHRFGFRFDLIVEDEWGRWLTEHKSHKKLPDDDYRFMDVQSNRYYWAIMKDKKLRKKYGPLTGILWNYIRTRAPSVPPQLKRGGISMARKYDTDAYTFVQTLVEYGLNPRDYRDKILALKRNSKFYRRVRVPAHDMVTKTLMREAVIVADKMERGDPPVRAIDRSCSYMCGFHQLCMTELYGGDADQVRRDLYRPVESGDYYGLKFQEES